MTMQERFDKDIDSLIDKILYQVNAWYCDEGDYQPTETEVREKIKAFIEKEIKLERERCIAALPEKEKGYPSNHRSWCVQCYSRIITQAKKNINNLKELR